MSHSDDDGLVLPPKLAPKQVVILPIIKSDSDKTAIMEYCRQIESSLKNRRYHHDQIKVMIDDRDMRGGEKKWFHVKRGVPIRLEVGPRDLADNKVFRVRRDTGESSSVDRHEFTSHVVELLDEIQANLYQRAQKHQQENTVSIDSLDEFKQYFTPKNRDKPEIHGGFALCHWCEDPKVYQILDELKVTIRCIPFNQPEESGNCIFTGQPSTKRAIFGKSY
jgi:prolyl-tRNA synthetase